MTVLSLNGLMIWFVIGPMLEYMMHIGYIYRIHIGYIYDTYRYNHSRSLILKVIVQLQFLAFHFVMTNVNHYFVILWF